MRKIKIAGLAALFLAALCCCTGCGKMPEEEAMQVSFYNITEIDAEMEIADVTLFACPGDAVTVEYRNYKNDKCVIEERDGILRIRRDYPRLNWNFLFGRKDYSLRIGIPENYSGGLSITTTTGKINASGLSLPEDASFTATTGGISLKDIDAAGELRICMTTGNIEGENLTCRELRAVSTTGKIALTGASADRMKLQTTTGAIDAELTAVAESAHIETTTGSIKCRIHDSAANFKITGHTTTGRRDVPAGGDGPKLLEANTTTGSVRIEFTE